MMFGNLFSKKRASRPPEREVADVYTELRQKVLMIEPDQIGLLATTPNQLIAVLMETGYPEAVATLAAIADGTVSMYFSNGGGVIGLGTHEGPRQAAKEFMSLASQYLDLAEPTKSFFLPESGSTRFYFVTPSCVSTIEAREVDLGDGQHNLSPLFYKGHEVITQVRLEDERLRAQ
jgi:hypothetical protein